MQTAMDITTITDTFQFWFCMLQILVSIVNYVVKKKII